MPMYLICGYGIPEDLERDQNYLTYLNIVFNTIFSRSCDKAIMIIACGGATSCIPPYDGTEAHLIAEYLQALMNREETKMQTSKWQILEEDQSLSTLENLFFAKKILQEHGLQNAVTIFCEATKAQRIASLGQKIFPQGCVVESIDFDISKNRYLDPEILERRDRIALEESLWTLEQEDRLQKHHEFFQKKFEFLRERSKQGVSHVDAVQEWYKRMPELIRELMPDHPLLKKFEQ